MSMLIIHSSKLVELSDPVKTDRRGFPRQMNLRRAIDGTRYTYLRESKNIIAGNLEMATFHYEFQNVPIHITHDLMSLMDTAIETLSPQVSIVRYVGPSADNVLIDSFTGHILSYPFEFTVDSRAATGPDCTIVGRQETCSFVIDFEGALIIT